MIKNFRRRSVSLRNRGDAAAAPAASAIIYSAVFSEPVRGVEEPIKFHLRPELRPAGFLIESFDRFQHAGLALICQKNETKADAERDLPDLISLADTDVTENARRETQLRHLESADKPHPLELANYRLERAERLHRRWTSNNDIAGCRYESRGMEADLSE